MRNCSIGSPEDGVAVANMFLGTGLMTYVSGQKTAKQDFVADPAKQLTKLPLVVITNRGTSGAAEIAATALVENKPRRRRRRADLRRRRSAPRCDA